MFVLVELLNIVGVLLNVVEYLKMLLIVEELDMLYKQFGCLVCDMLCDGEGLYKVLNFVCVDLIDVEVYGVIVVYLVLL